jgi:hypothetical protein
MWTTLALMSALSVTPAQGGKLELKNARFTYGILGQERKDATYLPGDMVALAFDIEGLQVKGDGSARYSMGMKLFSHKKNKNLFEQDPQEMTVVNSLGGTRQPVNPYYSLLPETEPGEYTMRVDVKDHNSNATQTLERKYTVKPLEFGIVRVGLVYLNLSENQAGGFSFPLYAPPLAVPGQSLMIHFGTVGYAEAGDKNLPKVKMELTIQDESGNPVLKKPISGTATAYESDQYKNLKFLPFHVPIQINRSGKFKILLSAKDEHSSKSATFPPLDLTVMELNK